MLYDAAHIQISQYVAMSLFPPFVQGSNQDQQVAFGCHVTFNLEIPPPFHVL